MAERPRTPLPDFSSPAELDAVPRSRDGHTAVFPCVADDAPRAAAPRKPADVVAVIDGLNRWYGPGCENRRDCDWPDVPVDAMSDPLLLPSRFDDPQDRTPRELRAMQLDLITDRGTARMKLEAQLFRGYPETMLSFLERCGTLPALVHTFGEASPRTIIFSTTGYPDFLTPPLSSNGASS